MPNGSRRKTIIHHALGVLAETGWILAVTALAFLMAVVAVWWFR